MRTMVFTDLMTMKRQLLSLLGIILVLGVFFVFAMRSLQAAVAAMVVMVPFIYLFSISAYDEMNGWERYRLTLPLTRRQVVWGRYAGLALVLVAIMLLAFAFAHVVAMVIGDDPSSPLNNDGFGTSFYATACSIAMGAAIVLVAASVSLPCIMRFGMTKATRVLPVVIVIVLAVGIAVFGEADINGLFRMLSGNMLDWGVDAVKMGIVVAIVVLMALYLASACLAAKLYEKREF